MNPFALMSSLWARATSSRRGIRSRGRRPACARVAFSASKSASATRSASRASPGPSSAPSATKSGGATPTQRGTLATTAIPRGLSARISTRYAPSVGTGKLNWKPGPLPAGIRSVAPLGLVTTKTGCVNPVWSEPSTRTVPALARRGRSVRSSARLDTVMIAKSMSSRCSTAAP